MVIFISIEHRILDGPVFKVRPNSIEASATSTVTLVCDVTGNPPPDILWIHEPHEKVSKTRLAKTISKSSMCCQCYCCLWHSKPSTKAKQQQNQPSRYFHVYVIQLFFFQVVGATPNLTNTVSNETAGLYICKASVVGFPEISATASLFLRGPPTILSHRRQYGIIGVNTRVECKAFSVPKVRFSYYMFC